MDLEIIYFPCHKFECFGLKSFLTAFVYFLAFEVKILVRSQRDPCLVLSLPNGSVGLATCSVSLGGLPIPHAALRGFRLFLCHTSRPPSLSSLNEKKKISWKMAFLTDQGVCPSASGPFLTGHGDADQGSRHSLTNRNNSSKALSGLLLQQGGQNKQALLLSLKGGAGNELVPETG